MMDNPEVTTRELMEVLPGPDFPTGGLVMGKSGIHRAYETGKGSIVLRHVPKLKQLNQVVSVLLSLSFLTWSIRPRSMNISFV